MHNPRLYLFITGVRTLAACSASLALLCLSDSASAPGLDCSLHGSLRHSGLIIAVVAVGGVLAVAHFAVMLLSVLQTLVIVSPREARLSAESSSSVISPWREQCRGLLNATAAAAGWASFGVAMGTAGVWWGPFLAVVFVALSVASVSVAVGPAELRTRNFWAATGKHSLSGADMMACFAAVAAAGVSSIPGMVNAAATLLHFVLFAVYSSNVVLQQSGVHAAARIAKALLCDVVTAACNISLLSADLAGSTQSGIVVTAVALAVCDGAVSLCTAANLWRQDRADILQHAAIYEVALQTAEALVQFDFHRAAYWAHGAECDDPLNEALRALTEVLSEASGGVYGEPATIVPASPGGRFGRSSKDSASHMLDSLLRGTSADTMSERFDKQRASRESVTSSVYQGAGLLSPTTVPSTLFDPCISEPASTPRSALFTRRTKGRPVQIIQPGNAPSLATALSGPPQRVRSPARSPLSPAARRLPVQTLARAHASIVQLNVVGYHQNVFELLPPQRLAEFQEHYVAFIQQNVGPRGVIDGVLGDRVRVTFNAFRCCPTHRTSAAVCALKCTSPLVKWWPPAAPTVLSLSRSATMPWRGSQSEKQRNSLAGRLQSPNLGPAAFPAGAPLHGSAVECESLPGKPDRRLSNSSVSHQLPPVPGESADVRSARPDRRTSTFVASQPKRGELWDMGEPFAPQSPVVLSCGVACGDVVAGHIATEPTILGSLCNWAVALERLSARGWASAVCDASVAADRGAEFAVRLLPVRVWHHKHCPPDAREEGVEVYGIHEFEQSKDCTVTDVFAAMLDAPDPYAACSLAAADCIKGNWARAVARLSDEGAMSLVPEDLADKLIMTAASAAAASAPPPSVILLGDGAPLGQVAPQPGSAPVSSPSPPAASLAELPAEPVAYLWVQAAHAMDPLSQALHRLGEVAEDTDADMELLAADSAVLRFTGREAQSGVIRAVSLLCGTPPLPCILGTQRVGLGIAVDADARCGSAGTMLHSAHCCATNARSFAQVLAALCLSDEMAAVGTGIAHPGRRWRELAPVGHLPQAGAEPLEMRKVLQFTDAECSQDYETALRHAEQQEWYPARQLLQRVLDVAEDPWASSLLLAVTAADKTNAEALVLEVSLSGGSLKAVKSSRPCSPTHSDSEPRTSFMRTDTTLSWRRLSTQMHGALPAGARPSQSGRQSLLPGLVVDSQRLSPSPGDGMPSATVRRRSTFEMAMQRAVPRLSVRATPGRAQLEPGATALSLKLPFDDVTDRGGDCTPPPGDPLLTGRQEGPRDLRRRSSTLHGRDSMARSLSCSSVQSEPWMDSPVEINVGSEMLVEDAEFFFLGGGDTGMADETWHSFWALGEVPDWFWGGCDLVRLLCVLTTSAALPVWAALQDSIPAAESAALYACDAVALCDVLLRFWRPFQQAGLVTARPALVRRHYLSTWFAPDLASALPWELAFRAGGAGMAAHPVLRLNRLAGAPRIPGLMQETAERLFPEAHPVLVSLFVSTIGLLYVLLYLGCIWAAVMERLEDGGMRRYLGFHRPGHREHLEHFRDWVVHVFHWAVRGFAGYGMLWPAGDASHLAALLCNVVGVGLFATLIAYMHTLLDILNGTEKANFERIEAVTGTLDYLAEFGRVSQQDRLLVLQYCKMLFRQTRQVQQQQFAFMIEELPAVLSDWWRYSINQQLLELTGDTFSTNPHFRIALLSALEEHFEPRHGVFVRRGEAPLGIMFIIRGRGIAYIGNRESPVWQEELGPGSWWGEVSALLGGLSSATVEWTEYTQLLLLPLGKVPRFKRRFQTELEPLMASAVSRREAISKRAMLLKAFQFNINIGNAQRRQAFRLWRAFLEEVRSQPGRPRGAPTERK